MASTSSYQYQPLEQGEIRLLQLLPRNPLVQDDPIRFHIVHTSFARCHVPDSFFSYEALSYVWGGELTDPVYCDNRKILVTPNLISALSILRETMPAYPSFHRTLWVDSICINQNDTAERGHQVRLMKDIYSHAIRVVVWLGGSQEIEEDLMRINHGHLSEHSIDPRLERTYWKQWTGSVARLFTQPWFNRVWVIQEVVFAAGAIVLGGKYSIKWEQLVDAAVAVKRDPRVTALQRVRCDAVLGIQFLRNQIQNDRNPILTPQLNPNNHPSKRSQWRKPGLKSSMFARKPKDLLELAELFRSNAATDPRDKIYAILGLASALETDRLASRIDADYNTPTNDLYLEFARLVLLGPEALRLLRNVNGLREQSSVLPSWVPDWSISLALQPLSELCRPEYLLPRQRAIILKQPRPDTLRLVGKCIDTIEAIGEVLERSSSEANLQVWYSWMSLGRERNLRAPPAFNWNAFLVPQDRGDYEGVLSETAHLEYRLKDIPKHCKEICSGRRYLLTKRRSSGLVPAGARIGDRIVLFPGAELPLVVRQDESNSTVRVVGQCYLDGVSLESLVQEKKYKTTEFCLR